MYIPEIESPSQLNGIHCSDCFREQLVKINRRRTKVIPCLCIFINGDFLLLENSLFRCLVVLSQ